MGKHLDFSLLLILACILTALLFRHFIVSVLFRLLMLVTLILVVLLMTISSVHHSYIICPMMLYRVLGSSDLYG